MSAESAIIVVYAVIVFAPFFITYAVFNDHLKKTQNDYKARPVATNQEK